MSCLAPLWLLLVLWVHCVYAQYYRSMPSDALTFILYNPSSGQQLAPVRYILSRTVNNNLIELPSMGRPCSCQDYACKCCLGLGFGVIREGLCLNVAGNLRDLSVNFVVELNHRSLADFDISPRSLPDFCAPLMLPIPIFTCLRLYNIHIIDRSLYVCTSLVFKILFQQMFEYKLTCLELSVKGVAAVAETDWNKDQIQLRTYQQQLPNNKLEVYAA
ncbi:uncharacterized protein LOC108659742 [Drosophila navojoa]|nr:uncharacterized protein LOC108659742 [Drosophila navojoa]